MREIIQHLNQVFENRIRLAIMSVLVINDSMDFNSLKQSLSLTDGNLASHIAMLEKNSYVTVSKKFVGKKPLTTYSATAAGKRAFSDHLDILEQLIRKTQL
ncbi:MAG TPA: transcriptional regulator [Bacteroidota bacterium]|nr:transcriptional regulator [Bacteroidota bacterium]